MASAEYRYAIKYLIFADTKEDLSKVCLNRRVLKAGAKIMIHKLYFRNDLSLSIFAYV